MANSAHTTRCGPNSDWLTLGGFRGEQARMWNVLLDFARSMGRAQDFDAVLERIVMAAAEITCSRRVSLMLPDEDHQFLTIACAIGMDDAMRAKVRVPIGEAIAGRAFASGRRITTDAATASNHGTIYEGQSFVSMPIRTATAVKRESVGVLNITHRYGDQAFEEWELEFIDLLGAIAGSVIDDTLWRQARESLLKFERDLQVARRIQQRSLPECLPTIPGFAIAAWGEPAEETGGDSYDIIGTRRDPASGAIRLCLEQPDRVVLLLADATGHGIGPALSVTQVRSMLRMAVRLDSDLARIVGQMNEQLCADLPRGRFITGWFGQLNTTDNTLTSVSAGQGPILHYEAAGQRVSQRKADTPPLGIVPDLDCSMARPIQMKPGDFVTVLSDGIFEAASGDHREFGADRAMDVIDQHRDGTAGQILEALREAVAQFVGGAPASDDRTAIILKRR